MSLGGLAEVGQWHCVTNWTGLPKPVGKWQDPCLIVLITWTGSSRSLVLPIPTHLWPRTRTEWFPLALSLFEMALLFGLFLPWPPHLVDLPGLRTSTCFWYLDLHMTAICLGDYWCLFIILHDLLWLLSVNILWWQNSLKDLTLFW